MFDLIACGELLIDFVSTQSGVTLGQAPAFQKAAGGAPANVAVGVARLGYRAGFLGQVGDDDFGHFLADTLAETGVDIGGLRFSAEARTALAFVSLRADGERSFMFYRHPSADMLWRPEDVDAGYAASTRIFHHGSISLISEPSRSATLAALEHARGGGALISYDPNLRLALWPAAEAARAGIMAAWPYADLIKVSEEELAFLSGETDLERGRARVVDQPAATVGDHARAGRVYLLHAGQQRRGPRLQGKPCGYHGRWGRFCRRAAGRAPGPNAPRFGAPRSALEHRDAGACGATRECRWRSDHDAEGRDSGAAHAPGSRGIHQGTVKRVLTGEVTWIARRLAHAMSVRNRRAISRFSSSPTLAKVVGCTLVETHARPKEASCGTSSISPGAGTLPAWGRPAL